MEINKEILAIVIELHKVIESIEDKEMKDYMRMTIAASFLHDLNDNEIDAFLKEYKSLRAVVAEICGESL